VAIPTDCRAPERDIDIASSIVGAFGRKLVDPNRQRRAKVDNGTAQRRHSCAPASAIKTELETLCLASKMQRAVTRGL